MSQPSAQKLLQKEQRQEKLLAKYRKEEHWMKWALGLSGVVILLLLLFLGYATDWTRGLYKKDNIGAITPTSLDQSKNSSAESASPSGGSGGSGGGTGTTTGSSTDTTSRNNEQSRSSTTSNTSTTNNTTNTTNNPPSPTPNPTPSPTPTPTPQPPTELLNLYTDIGAGENISMALNLAETLGITANCQNELLLQVCTFSEDGATVTTKNLLGTGIITSITAGF